MRLRENSPSVIEFPHSNISDIMFPIADLHTHTRLCHHADGEPADYVDCATKLGLKILGISDHFPAPIGYDVPFRMQPKEWSDYCSMVHRAVDIGAQNGLDVLFATEYDFVPGHMREVVDALAVAQEKAGREFDYLIGSVHYTGDFAFDDPDKVGEWETRGPDAVWEQYLDSLEQFVTEHVFQIMAHSDLPKKFGFMHHNPDYVTGRFRTIFRIAAEKNVCLELNTAGLRVPAKEIYPSVELLKIAFDANMKITFGSDAHAPGLVARDFEHACALAKEVGWTEACFFRKGKQYVYPL